MNVKSEVRSPKSEIRKPAHAPQVSFVPALTSFAASAPTGPDVNSRGCQPTKSTCRDFSTLTGSNLLPPSALGSMRIPKPGEHARPGRCWTRPRVQQFLPARDSKCLHNCPPPMFSARARKTAPEAGALPSLLRNSGKNGCVSSVATLRQHLPPQQSPQSGVSARNFSAASVRERTWSLL